MVEISVIVPFHNAERYIGECARALLGQDYPAERFEVIMVDNNSTDRSAEIVRRFPELRLVAEPKQGAYAARNRGLRLARAPLLAFTDSDCVVAPSWLSRVAATFARGDVDVVLGRRYYGRETPLLRFIADYEASYARAVFASAKEESYFGYTNNMAARRELFEQLGPFDELRRGGDTLFVQRVVAHRSTDAVVFDDKLEIRHLEMTGTGRYFGKRLAYGVSFGRRRQSLWRRGVGTSGLRALARVARLNPSPMTALAQAVPTIWLGKALFLCGCGYGRASTAR